MVDGLEQQVAQFAFQFGPCLTLDGVGYLIGLFDGVGRDGGEVLFQIPRTARGRIAEPSHDLQQPGYATVRIVDERVGGGAVFGHCSSPAFGVILGLSRS
jgi:hypothetical protein